MFNLFLLKVLKPLKGFENNHRIGQTMYEHSNLLMARVEAQAA